jgi:hypothetical protein
MINNRLRGLFANGCAAMYVSGVRTFPADSVQTVVVEMEQG